MVFDFVEPCCTICGFVFSNCNNDLPPGSWIKHFRLFYIDVATNRYAVTGVGLYDDACPGRWIAPLSYNERRGSQGIDEPLSIRVAVTFQDPINNRWGYPFHEGCWSLLEGASYPRPIPFVRLWHLCRSLPCPRSDRGLSLSSHFGGPRPVGQEWPCYPWEDSKPKLDGARDRQFARHNPNDIPEIRRLADWNQGGPSGSQPGPKNAFGEPFQPSTRANDIFAALPVEICIAIARHLPTKDAMNARRASKSFWATFHSNQFWMSRFEPRGERWWVPQLLAPFRFRMPSPRWLYRLTSNDAVRMSMQNRHRVWCLIQRALVPLRLTPSKDFEPVDQDYDFLDSQGVLADVRPDIRAPYWDFTGGCRIFFEQDLRLPLPLSKVAFSFVRVGHGEFISGMRFYSSSGEVKQLGYRGNNQERILHVTALTGFITAVSAQGIQGIQCLDGLHRCLPWVGRHRDLPKTARLARWDRIEALEAGFDGFKMVELRIRDLWDDEQDEGLEDNLQHELTHESEDESDFMVISMPTRRTHSEGEAASGYESDEKWEHQIKLSAMRGGPLRRKAYWYPDIPPRHLKLNEHCFHHRDHLLKRYEPLSWISFGGPGGILLPHLTGVTIAGGYHAHAIKFHYDRGDIPPRDRTLGHFHDGDPVAPAFFSIDGPGGERIDKVDVCFGSTDYGWWRECGIGKVMGIREPSDGQIGTNRGRFKDFLTTPSQWKMFTPLTYSAGETISGLYSAKRWDKDGMICLGIITEAL